MTGMLEIGVSQLKKTRTLMLIASFAVVYTLLRILPTFPMLGVSGASFSVADAIAPIYGIILGPFVGVLSVVVGTFLAFALGRPVIFLGLDFLPAAVNVLVVGLLVWRRWVTSAAINVIVLLLFLVNPFTLLIVSVSIPGLNVQFYAPFAWMHFLALIMLFSPLSRRAASWVTEPSIARLAPGIIILSLIGTLTQHATGSLLWETVYGAVLGAIKLDAFYAIWKVIFWVYPFERTVIIIVATIIGTALVRALRRAGLASTH